MNEDHGYVVDAPYTYGYYPEMTPVQVEHALLVAGFDRIPSGPSCELGFGQGLNICVNAAADATRRWWGNDFMPDHVAFARSLAEAAEFDATLSGESFSDFCSRDDLPEFSFVAIHGVWSWIPESDRAVIVDFLRRRLQVGGAVYLSYNTSAGWAAMAPIRQLFAEYARRACSPAQGSVARMKDAIGFVRKMLATNPPYARLNPIVVERMQRLVENPDEYLVHEYLTSDWNLTTFADVARAMDAADLSFVAPANLAERVEALHLSDEQRAFLEGVTDPVLRETTRDVLVHQKFRRDLWVRRPSRLSPGTQRERLARQPLVLAVPRSRAPARAAGARGTSTLRPAVYGPLLDALDAANGPVEYARLESAMAEGPRLSEEQTAQALAILVGLGAVHPARAQESADRSVETAARLNRRLLEDATRVGRTGVLASPVTGGGVSASHVAQLFLAARREGADTPERLARFAWSALKGQGIRMTAMGRTLETAGENLAELTRRARQYEAQDERVFRRLAVV